MPSFLFENQYTCLAAGVDEVGCGCWAGPVVASAVIIHQDSFPQPLQEYIHDSKKLSLPQRESVYARLMELPKSIFDFGIGEASVEEIDTLNIRKASFRAMERAIAALTLSPHVILLDGKIIPRDWPYKVEAIPKGDQKSYSIAAASIIAKVTRDRAMQELHEHYPYYGWQRNVGYGTKLHEAALDQYGVSEHHRRSYAPIAKRLTKAL